MKLDVLRTPVPRTALGLFVLLLQGPFGERIDPVDKRRGRHSSKRERQRPESLTINDLRGGSERHLNANKSGIKLPREPFGNFNSFFDE